MSATEVELKMYVSPTTSCCVVNASGEIGSPALERCLFGRQILIRANRVLVIVAAGLAELGPVVLSPVRSSGQVWCGKVRKGNYVFRNSAESSRINDVESPVIREGLPSGRCSLGLSRSAGRVSARPACS